MQKLLKNFSSFASLKYAFAVKNLNRKKFVMEMKNNYHRNYIKCRGS